MEEIADLRSAVSTLVTSIAGIQAADAQQATDVAALTDQHGNAHAQQAAINSQIMSSLAALQTEADQNENAAENAHAQQAVINSQITSSLTALQAENAQQATDVAALTDQHENAHAQQAVINSQITSNLTALQAENAQQATDGANLGSTIDATISAIAVRKTFATSGIPSDNDVNHWQSVQIRNSCRNGCRHGRPHCQGINSTGWNGGPLSGRPGWPRSRAQNLVIFTGVTNAHNVRSMQVDPWQWAHWNWAGCGSDAPCPPPVWLMTGGPPTCLCVTVLGLSAACLLRKDACVTVCHCHVD